jgi:hypothetical protein
MNNIETWGNIQLYLKNYYSSTEAADIIDEDGTCDIQLCCFTFVLLINIYRNINHIYLETIFIHQLQPRITTDTRI